MKGKVVKFEPEDYAALDQLARDRMMTFQELADEAFRDLLKKHGRPTDLKEALRRSAGVTSGAAKHKKHSRSAAHRH
jgi:non-homologous end joining protein Ku